MTRPDQTGAQAFAHSSARVRQLLSLEKMKVEFIEIKPQTGLMIGSSMLVAGLLLVAWKYQRIVEEVNSLRWPSTLGLIESSNFHTSTRRTTNKTTTTTHHGEFSYRYVIKSKEYIGHRYDAKGNMQTGLDGESAKIKTMMHRGATVKVFYDPDHPSRSMLKNGVSEDTWVRITFSSFLLLVGIIVTSYQLKRLMKPAHPTVGKVLH